jgi:hypothetical protein
MEEKIQYQWTRQSLLPLYNFAQITNKQFHLLIVHNDNKSNNGQIGQVVVVAGSGKTQDFFLMVQIYVQTYML